MLTVCSVHDIVEVVYGQASVCVGFAGDSTMHVVAVAARFVSASAREEIRYTN